MINNMYDGGNDDNNDLSTAEQIWIIIGLCSIVPIIFFILMLFAMLMTGGNLI